MDYLRYIQFYLNIAIENGFLSFYQAVEIDLTSKQFLMEKKIIDYNKN